MPKVFAVRGDAAGFLQTSVAVTVLDGLEGSCRDVTGGFHHHLWGLVHSSSGAKTPDHDAAIQNALHCKTIKNYKSCSTVFVRGWLSSEEVEPLLGFFDYVCCV